MRPMFMRKTEKQAVGSSGWLSAYAARPAMVPASAHDGHVKRLAKGIEALRCIGRRTTEPPLARVMAAVRICPLAATQKSLWPSQNVTGSASRRPGTLPTAEYDRPLMAGSLSAGARRLFVPAHRPHGIRCDPCWQGPDLTGTASGCPDAGEARDVPRAAQGLRVCGHPPVWQGRADHPGHPVDAGFDATVLAAMMGALDRFTGSEIPVPGGSSAVELRAFYAAWRSELTA